ncbi:MAG TPA: hypothetical protein VKZ50_17170 [bacterium]|nr:hypothetical protein [bacterium]
MSTPQLDRPLSVLPRGLSPWVYAAIALVAYALNDLVALLTLGSKGMIGQLFVLPNTQVRNFLLVTFHLVHAYVIFPALMAFCSWMDRAPGLLIQRLIETGVVEGKSDAAHGKLETYQVYRLGKGSWFALYLVGVGLALIGALSLQFNPPQLPAADLAFVQLHVPMTFVLLLALWLTACMIVEATTVLRTIFAQRTLRLHPFDPDRVCGLGPLKQYAQRLLYLIIIVGVDLMMATETAILKGNFASDRILHVYLGIYPVLAPVCFFWTLWYAHMAMVRERARIFESMIPVSFVFDPAGSSVSTRAQLAKFKETWEWHRLMKEFPVWPFDAGSLRDVVAVAVIPGLAELARLFLFRH